MPPSHLSRWLRRVAVLAVPIAWSLACGGRGQAPKDEDEDGYNDVADCDDSDPKIHPGAAEPCDGVDQNCAWADWDCVGDGRAAVLSLGEPPFEPDVASGDVDADGVADLIWSEPGAVLSWRRAPLRTGGTAGSIPYLYGGQVAVGDLDGDSVDDLILEVDTGVFGEDLSGWFGPIAPLTADRPPDFAVNRVMGESLYAPSDVEVIGDLDGDGLNDLVLAYPPPNYGTLSWIGWVSGPPADGTVGDVVETLSVEPAIADVVDVGDLDGDGHDSFAYVLGGLDHTIAIGIVDGPLPEVPGALVDATTLTLEIDRFVDPPDVVATQDLDGDGLAELVTSVPDLYVFPGNPTGVLDLEQAAWRTVFPTQLAPVWRGGEAGLAMADEGSFRLVSDAPLGTAPIDWAPTWDLGLGVSRDLHALGDTEGTGDTTLLADWSLVFTGELP